MTGLAELMGSALAADMTGAEIKAYLTGKTVYLQTTALWHGKWQIKGNTACTEWKEKPNTGCVRYDKTGDKTASGNAEKLTP